MVTWVSLIFIVVGGFVIIVDEYKQRKARKILEEIKALENQLWN